MGILAWLQSFDWTWAWAIWSWVSWTVWTPAVWTVCQLGQAVNHVFGTALWLGMVKLWGWWKTPEKKPEASKP